MRGEEKGGIESVEKTMLMEERVIEMIASPQPELIFWPHKSNIKLISVRRCQGGGINSNLIVPNCNVTFPRLCA